MNKQTCTIRSPDQLQSVGAAIREMLAEGAVEISFQPASEKRRDIMNRLAFHWYDEAGQQGDNDKHYYRAYCKLHHGVAIAKECYTFAMRYDTIVKPLPYETKLDIMKEPFNLPVTSLFNVEQMKRYLDAIQLDLSNQGMVLTTSDDLYWSAMGVTK